MELPPIEVTRKSGDERFIAEGSGANMCLAEFWRWSTSDLVSNATRGVLAEFIVAQAIGDRRPVRNEWDAFDLLSPSGIRVEVKSAAYVQSWRQRQYSQIRFGVRESLHWDRQTNDFGHERSRQADVYVFALLDHKDQATIDPLNLRQWAFYVMSTADLTSHIGAAKSVSLSKLQSFQPITCRYDSLADAIVLMQPALDANYRLAAADAYARPGEGAGG